MPQRGMRSYLAVQGGFDIPAVLGSASTDLNAKFGGFHGRALRDGDQIPLGKPPRQFDRKVGVRQLLCGNRILAPPGPEYLEFSPVAQPAYWCTAW